MRTFKIIDLETAPRLAPIRHEPAREISLQQVERDIEYQYDRREFETFIRFMHWESCENEHELRVKILIECKAGDVTAPLGELARDSRLWASLAPPLQGREIVPVERKYARKRIKKGLDDWLKLLRQQRRAAEREEDAARENIKKC